MFEIRCKVPSVYGQYSAFWMKGNEAWPPEIDAFEYNATFPNHAFSGVHYGPSLGSNSANCYVHYDLPFDISQDFHTWTVVWTPTQITWFLDGREIKTDNDPTHIPGNYSPSMWERCH